MTPDPTDILHRIAQECIAKSPVVILGSGASAAFGIPGMPQLQAHLQDSSCIDSQDPEDQRTLSEFIEALSSKDLETALNDMRLPDHLTRRIVEVTWDFLAPKDYEVFERVINNRNLFPLTKLFRHLLNSTKTEIDVVTPNYDRLAEYAADAAGLAHYTGFDYGYIRNRSINGRHVIHVSKNPVRTVNVWKVHGSFDWFRDNKGIVVGPPMSSMRTRNATPLIVTPGIEKYRLTQDEPFVSIKSEADRALQNANAYLCIGYGFNDTHLQTKIIERSRRKDVPLVILTRTLSESAKHFLNSSGCENYMAIERCGSGCRVLCSEFPQGAEIESQAYWELHSFLSVVIS
jgi:hypothetical protein